MTQSNSQLLFLYCDSSTADRGLNIAGEIIELWIARTLIWVMFFYKKQNPRQSLSKCQLLFVLRSTPVKLIWWVISFLAFFLAQSGWFIQTDLHQKVCRKRRKWRSREESQRRRKQVRNYATCMVTCKANVLQWQKMLDCTIIVNFKCHVCTYCLTYDKTAVSLWLSHQPLMDSLEFCQM